LLHFLLELHSVLPFRHLIVLLVWALRSAWRSYFLVLNLCTRQ
jgi:hypothetical protein